MTPWDITAILTAILTGVVVVKFLVDLKKDRQTKKGKNNNSTDAT